MVIGYLDSKPFTAAYNVRVHYSRNHKRQT